MKNRFPNRRWCIINSGDAANVNFNQVMENSVETLRYSVDKSKTFVKYNVSTHPIPRGTNDQGDIIYGDNVDSQGRTYTLYYETIEQVVDFYSDQPGQGHVVTGSGIVNFPTENVTGSGILYESGVTVDSSAASNHSTQSSICVGFVIILFGPRPPNVSRL